MLQRFCGSRKGHFIHLSHAGAAILLIQSRPEPIPQCSSHTAVRLCGVRVDLNLPAHTAAVILAGCAGTVKIAKIMRHSAHSPHLNPIVMLYHVDYITFTGAWQSCSGVSGNGRLTKRLNYIMRKSQNRRKIGSYLCKSSKWIVIRRSLCIHIL